jgi:probable addiction module antidote protein
MELQTVVPPAKGMAAIAEQTGLSREQLYRSFSSKGNPTLKTTLAVMRALGIELTAKAATGGDDPPSDRYGLSILNGN